MVFIVTILVVLVVAVVAAVFVKRRIDLDLIESSEPKNLMDTNLRPLFLPDEKEMRSDAADGDAIEAEPVNETREKKLAMLEELRQTWRENPTKRDAVEMLITAVETESASVFSSVVSEVIREWRKEQFNGLSATDLADLIESDLWLLPTEERMSGNGFLVKQEIAKLRSQ